MTLDEIVFLGSSLVLLTVLVLDMVGVLHRGTGFRVQAAGLLFMNIAQVVSVFAHLHGHGIFPVLSVGFAIFGVGVFISAKDRRTA